MHSPIIASIFVGTGVALAIVCSLGLATVKSALARLHFSAPVTSFSAVLIVAGIWLDDPAWQSRLKGLLVAILLFLTNAILSHSTARAIRIRQEKHLEPSPEEIPEKIQPITKENPSGVRA